MISLKHRFPFRLATTSFIYPADYTTNVQRLSHLVDEVELLFFESLPDSLPTQEETHRLAAMAHELDLTYDVHLPLDIDMAAPHEHERHSAIGRMADIIKWTAGLSPTTFTLHLGCSLITPQKKELLSWQADTKTALSDLLDLCGIDAGKISIETLDYPSQWFAPLVKELNVAVCLDVGHILRYGYDLKKVIDDYADRISILHLHAVTQGEDHQSLIHLDRDSRDILIPFLKYFTGSVSIEVFSADKLDTSLTQLKRMYFG